MFDRFRGRIMFPLADRRGRVLGFGARALSPEDQPKYLNTSENALFVKGRQLFGQDVARAHAAKAGSVIVAEGYTDVIALHQAGLRNAVGIMGTAMTPDQVGALAGLAPTALLALDADSAGQEAMLRAARVASDRKLPLRVVPMPAGLDPADLVQRSGAKAMADLVDASVPFERFQVERALALADLGGAEGKDALIAQLRPVFAQIPASVQRQELLHLVADTLDLAEALVVELLEAGGRAPAVAARTVAVPPTPPRVASRGERIEPTFLALCIALPGPGREALDRVTAEHFSSTLLARAVDHLRVHLAAPLEGIADEDEELRSLMTELSVRAARGNPAREMLRVEELQLERARIDRAVTAARGGNGGSVADLARARAQVSAELDTAIEAALNATG